MSPAGAARRLRHLKEKADELLRSLNGGRMSTTAYDTAWLARLRDPLDQNRRLFPSTVAWMLRGQHRDGSWGARVETLHDRAISTLIAVIALAEGKEEAHRPAVRAGLQYLAGIAPRLNLDPYETVGFEIIFPALLKEARGLGLSLPYQLLSFVEGIRAEKLARIPYGSVYSIPTPLVHSLEYLGESLQVDRVRPLQAANGSFGNSPSATAYTYRFLPDRKAGDYLREVVSISPDGGCCNVYPFEVFERAWVLANLVAGGEEFTAAVPHLRYLQEAMTPNGAGISASGLPPDSDDTALVIHVLDEYGYPTDATVLQSFEPEEGFSCHPFERNPSVSANIHILLALRLHRELPDHGRLINKLVQYLAGSRQEGRYWVDKWHISPYYATAHAVMALNGLSQSTVMPALEWLLETQRSDGSWGLFEGTAEETAYALQALMAAGRRSEPGFAQAVERGAACLWDRIEEQDYPELWVGKGLYTPQAVVRSAVLGALFSFHRYWSQRGWAA